VITDTSGEEVGSNPIMGFRPYNNSGDIVVGIEVETVVVIVDDATDDVLGVVGSDGGLRVNDELE
jgi:hypothetical protein